MHMAENVHGMCINMILRFALSQLYSLPTDLLHSNTFGYRKRLSMGTFVFTYKTHRNLFSYAYSYNPLKVATAKRTRVLSFSEAFGKLS